MFTVSTGQFGMGPDQLGEISKPRRNPWVDEQIEDGTFGGEGAGLEAIAAGGLHSLFIDEKGTVNWIYFLVPHTWVLICHIVRSGHAEPTMTRHSVGLPKISRIPPIQAKPLTLMS
jgi:hypothetical protein